LCATLRASPLAVFGTALKGVCRRRASAFRGSRIPLEDFIVSDKAIQRALSRAQRSPPFREAACVGAGE